MRLSREKKGDRESWLAPPDLPSTNTIVVLDICQASYRFVELRDGWQDVLKGLRCPACGSERMGHHSSYQKYLYEQPITILRLRCRGCGRTHAVIPSWSLPDTSVGSAEVERYLMVWVPEILPADFRKFWPVGEGHRECLRREAVRP